MVVSARLAWARGLIASGAPAHITVGSAAHQGRAKAKIRIYQSRGITSMVTRSLLLVALDGIAQNSQIAITVDRGHLHSDGCSEICLWLDSPSASPSHAEQDGRPCRDRDLQQRQRPQHHVPHSGSEVRLAEDDVVPEEGKGLRSAGLALLQSGVSAGAAAKGDADDFDDDDVVHGSVDASAQEESVDCRSADFASLPTGSLRRDAPVFVPGGVGADRLGGAGADPRGGAKPRGGAGAGQRADAGRPCSAGHTPRPGPASAASGDGERDPVSVQEVAHEEENNAARLIQWAEEQVMVLSEFASSALPDNQGAVSANSLEEALERYKLLEAEAIAALADARAASLASPADAAQQIRLKAAQTVLVRSRLTSRRWAAMAEQRAPRT